MQHKNNTVNPAIKLRKLGVNTTSLLEISLLAMYNPDQLCLVDNSVPLSPVSHLFLSYSKRKRKMAKVMKTLGIFNILYIKKNPDKHIFMGKAKTGKLLHTEFMKNEFSYRKATAMALLNFVDQINDVNFEVDEEATKGLIENNQAITMDNIDASGLAPEVITSIKDLISRVQSGEFEGMDATTVYAGTEEGDVTYSQDSEGTLLESINSGSEWKQAVAAFDDLATTYPEPEEGWSVIVTSEKAVYCFTDNVWAQTASIEVEKIEEDDDGIIDAEYVELPVESTTSTDTE